MVRRMGVELLGPLGGYVAFQGSPGVQLLKISLNPVFFELCPLEVSGDFIP